MSIFLCARDIKVAAYMEKKLIPVLIRLTKNYLTIRSSTNSFGMLSSIEKFNLIFFTTDGS